jgi:hypothetical protein
MSFDSSPSLPQAPAQRSSMPTVMMLETEQPARVAYGWGRWIGGPILAVGVALGTVAVAGAVMPRGGREAEKDKGRLMLQTDPEGAAVVLDGKLTAHTTPAVVEGDVGSTLRVEFHLEGYRTKEADVFVGEGEHPFRAKLEKEAPPPPVVATPEPGPEPPPEPEHAAPPRHKRDHAPTEPIFKMVHDPVGEGSGTLSVFVHPWAIVYVDGTKLRQTPLEGYQIPAGRHTIDLVNDGVNKRERVVVVVKAGETQEIRREWEPGSR